MRTVFKDFRQTEEIITRISDCIETELQREGITQKVAELSKVEDLIEFMKCFPLLQKRDKNESTGMNYVMKVNNYQLQQDQL